MKLNNEKIAIVIYNYIQCLNILPGAKELMKLGYDVDLYSIITDDKTGFQDIFDDTRKELEKNGFKVYTKAKKYYYKILLEPYDSPFLALNVKYKIRYRYGQITAKPNLVYLPSMFMKYDCVLCSGKYESRLLNNYTNTRIVGDLKYIDFKKKNYNKNKKVLLYLPTYGKESSIELILKEIKELRKDYYVIVKIHHGTCFLFDEKKRIDLIKECVDEFYDLHKELKELLEISDVVLTDNSASVFDAIYNNIPVAVFTNDINQNKMGDFNTIQYELFKEGILPYTNDSKKIKMILDDALSDKYIKKQKKWNEDNFEHSLNPLKDFVKIIDEYLNDEIDIQSYLLRKALHDDYYRMVDQINNDYIERKNIYEKIDETNKIINNLNQEIIELKDKNIKLQNKNIKIQNENIKIQNENIKIQNENIKIQNENNDLLRKNNCIQSELTDYKKGKLYKICTKIYKIKSGGKRCEKK